MNRISKIILLFSFALSGCQSNPASPVPTTLPVATANPGQSRFANADVAFAYPSDWKPIPGSKSQLKVATAADGQMTLDIPNLPTLFAGMIPMDQVENGYIDDVKKRMPDAAITKLPDPTLPNSRQLRVELAGHVNGKPTVDEAVMVFHASKLYILSIDSDQPTYPQMHAAMDAVLKSWQWTK